MRHHRGVTGPLRHIDRGKGLAEGANLVDLDEDRIPNALFDPAIQDLDVGDKDVVANELALAADLVGEQLPARPVLLGHAVLDRQDRIGALKLGEILDLFFNRAPLAFALVDIFPVLEKLRCCAIEPEHHVVAGFETCRVDRLEAEIKRGLRGRQVWREASFVADIGVVSRLFQRCL